MRIGCRKLMFTSPVEPCDLRHSIFPEPPFSVKCEREGWIVKSAPVAPPPLYLRPLQCHFSAPRLSGGACLPMLCPAGPCHGLWPPQCRSRDREPIRRLGPRRLVPLFTPARSLSPKSEPGPACEEKNGGVQRAARRGPASAHSFPEAQGRAQPKLP